MLFTAAHPLWLTWVGMHQRCYMPTAPGFHNYGGRGINVCTRWHTFSNFVQDMGKRPADHQLDRINCDGPYSPKNCQWSSRLDNSRNKRNTIRILYEGKEQPLSTVAESLGIPIETAYRRHQKGWPLEKVLEPSVTAFKGRIKSMEGQVFGRITVLGLNRTDKDSAWWNCRCSCGKLAVIKGRNLRSGNTRSCGCLLAEYRSKRQLPRLAPKKLPHRLSPMSSPIPPTPKMRLTRGGIETV
jgi:hypothetical protein